MYMKKIFLAVLLIVSTLGKAQILDPASWSFTVSEKNPEVNDTITLVIKAKIDPKWYLYSSDFDPDLGPMVTTFNFEQSAAYDVIGEIKPVDPKKKYDDIFEGDYTYFTKEGVFLQKIKLKEPSADISWSINYQVCSDVDGRCIPFDKDFSLSIKAKGAAKSSKKPIEEQKKVTQPQEDTSSNQGQSFQFKKIDKENDTTQGSKAVDDLDEGNTYATPTDNRNPNDAYTLTGFFFLAFLAGLAALLTPCVFPMIPMTVTFFTGKAKSKAQANFRAIIYGLSIIAIYTIFGTIIAVVNGPEFANWLSTHWIPNILFFLIFLVFALSFLGLFEITLPSSIVNKVDSQADKGGLAGVFFMAFTLVLVSFSCTGPLVGSILVESAGGQVIKPLVGMLGFSLAFALPFTLFAIFPNWLSSLPKSGGWLNSVKVVLGFLELALGLKFLSVADQVYHWGILDREVYLALWIVIFSLMGLYLLGKIRLPHDSKMEHTPVMRLMMAIVTFSFVVYLIPGMFGAPLKALAGYLPPMTTLDFNLYATAGNTVSAEDQAFCGDAKFDEILHFQHGIKGYFTLEEALECSKELNKPIFVDFTGHGCVNCREMEQRVWSEPEVLKILKEDYVMLALYVDEKMELPESDWYTSTYDNKVKKTMGKQNADYQITRFNNNAQPFYIILDSNGNQLIDQPIGYELNIDKFVNYLEKGITAYKKEAS